MKGVIAEAVRKSGVVPDSIIGVVPYSWTVSTLGASCADSGGGIQTGPFGSQLHASDYVEIGIPSIMPQNIGDNRISEVEIARITELDALRLRRYRVRKGDIVHSRRGDVERRALIREREDGWLCGTGCLRVRFGDSSVDPKFAAYYLGHPAVRSWIVAHAQGATMPNLNTAILSSLPFITPPVSEQRAIGHILGALDDKIELNRKMSETLEAMARALFKSWFVDFDPVRAKAEGRDPGLPPEVAAVFPDSFEDSELGEIPKEWRAGLLGAVAVNERRVVSHNDIPDGTPYIGLEHMPRRSIALDRWEYGAQLVSNKSQFRRGEFLFGKLRPYFQKVGVAPVSGVCSTDILVVSPAAAGWDAFVLMHLSSNELITHTDRCSTGTKMPRAPWEHIARYEVALPPATVARSFTETVVPMVERIVAAIHESRTLAELRDALLPKLISGEIRVSEAERIVERAL